MIYADLAIFALLAIIATGLVLLTGRDWRWLLAALGVQVLAVAWLVAIYLPFNLAVVKLVVGWMSAAVLGVSLVGSPHSLEEVSAPSRRIFRLIAGGLALLVVFSTGPRLAGWLQGVSIEVADAALVLIAAGLLQLGMSVRSFRTAIGLITALSGFELLYAAVEVSVLVVGLLAAVNLGLALVGAYWLSLEQQEAQP